MTGCRAISSAPGWGAAQVAAQPRPSHAPPSAAPPSAAPPSLDAAASYQLAFGAIRQLGVLLRNALTAKTADAFKEVYCWQVGVGARGSGLRAQGLGARLCFQGLEQGH
jgi:hypothetical protein